MTLPLIKLDEKDQNNQKNFFHDQDYIQKWEVKYFQLNAGAGQLKWFPYI